MDCKICACKIEDDSIVLKTKKGVQTLNKSSTLRKLSLKFVLNDVLHGKCRKNFINSKSITLQHKHAVDTDERAPITRSSRYVSEPSYQPRTNCFFCNIQLIRIKCDEEVMYYMIIQNILAR